MIPKLQAIYVSLYDSLQYQTICNPIITLLYQLVKRKLLVIQGRLNNIQIKALAKAGKPGKYADGGGMYLEIGKSGAASWRYKYRIQIDGRRVERRYTIGSYPEVGVAQARTELAEARKLVAQNIDPVAARRIKKAASGSQLGLSVQDAAEAWLARMKPTWSEKHYRSSQRGLERDIYPAIGNLPVTSVTPAMVAAAVGVIEKRAPETSHRIRRHLHGVFQLALVNGQVTTNPVISVPGAATANTKKRPAIIDCAELRGVLQAAEVANTTPSVRMAGWLLAHTAVRPGELVPAKWPELYLDDANPRWEIPRSRMKVQSREQHHSIPLAPSVVARLKLWRQATGGKGYVFPSPQRRRRHISIEYLEKFYRVTLGLRGRHVPHGWRSAFSTNSHDALTRKGRRRFDEDVIEIALDHLVGGKVRQAYDRGERWDARRKLMHWWADQLQVA